jgi:hypothetical protein
MTGLGRAMLAMAAGLAALAATPPPDPVAPSTREMAALLRERAAAVDPMKLPYVVNERRADLMRAALLHPRPFAEQIALRFDYASELVNAGRLPEALRAIEELRRDAEAIGPEAARRSAPLLMTLEATAHFRQGELQNCAEHHNRQSCLLPIRGRGVHRQREGSARALEVLTRLLAQEPGNLRARWLLNIAHMTLGTYPDQVPPAQLIPPATFTAEAALPRFPDVAREAGLDVFGLSGGAILDDFDRDGDFDLMTSSIGFNDQMKLFRNRGDGTFEDRTAVSGLLGETGGLNLVQADYDNDGWVDALVLRGGWMGSEGRFPVSLLRNTGKGDGTFTDVTRAAGLLRYGPTQTATWLDYDGDGWLDLFVGNESVPGHPTPCQLFHSNRDGTFTEVAAAVGVDVTAFVKGVVSGDYDGDGRPDLYLSVGGGDNFLFHNDGPGPGGGWRFTNVAAAAGVTGPPASFPALFFDYDNDGHADLFVSGYGAMAEDVAADYLGLPTSAERPRLYRNRGDGTFEDATRAASLWRVLTGMGLNFGDLDNDGFLDIYVGTGNPELSTLVPNRLFRNDGGRRFQDVTTAVDVGHLQKGHAISFGDVDGDGDQDLFELMGGAVSSDRAWSALYQNPGSPSGWLELELVGTRANRSAIGARVKVTLETPGGPRVLHRTVSSGGSFGASPLRLAIGLGDARRVRSVEVRWPSPAAPQTFTGLELRRRYRLTEGQAQPAPEPWGSGGEAPKAR